MKKLILNCVIMVTSVMASPYTGLEDAAPAPGVVGPEASADSSGAVPAPVRRVMPITKIPLEPNEKEMAIPRSVEDLGIVFEAFQRPTKYGREVLFLVPEATSPRDLSKLMDKLTKIYDDRHQTYDAGYGGYKRTYGEVHASRVSEDGVKWKIKGWHTPR